jgi:hypothetical protein
MSVHVTTCTSCVEVVALIRCVFLHFVAVSDQLLEQLINIKFCVKLGKNANDTLCNACPRPVGENL